MGVVTTTEVGEGEVFGPIPPTLTLADPAVLIGHRTCDTPPDIHSVKLDIVKHREGSALAEWVPYVQAARDQREQNMEAYLNTQGQLYYRTMRALQPGTELFIWYSDEYAAYMGVPPIQPAYSKGSSFICPYCMESFMYANCLRAHLRFKCKYRHHVIMAQKAAIMASAPLQCTMPASGTREEGTPPAMGASQQSPSKAPESPFSTTTGGSSPCHSPEVPGCSAEPQTAASLKRPREGREDSVSPKRRALSVSPKSETSDESYRVRSPQDMPSPSLLAEEAGQDEARSAFQRVDRQKKFSEEPRIPSTLSSSLLPTAVSHMPSLPTSTILTPNPMNMSDRSRLMTNPYQMLPGVPTTQLQMSLQNKMRLSSRLLCGPAGGRGANENNPLPGLPSSGLPDVQMLNSKHFENNNIHPKLPFPGELHRLPQGVPYVYRSPNPMVDNMLHTSPRGPPIPSLSVAQNWCAKCNATFRMTSDLVYHMRSHHKREFDPVKKKRDDKLRCDVCGETFRERHHLTRHMTSHA